MARLPVLSVSAVLLIILAAFQQQQCVSADVSFHKHTTAELELPLCYSSEASPLDYIPLSIRSEPSDGEGITEKDAARDAPYWDLSCPWEWSKFSCAHQGQTAKAIASFALSQKLEGEDCRLNPFDAQAFLALLGRRKIVFVGDSLTRQMFTSLLCLLHASPAVRVVSDTIEWSTKWSCLRLPNCIERGRHSGFTKGCVTFTPAAASAAASATGGGAPEADALEVCYDYKDDGELVAFAMLRHPDLRARRDIVVANSGIHMTLRERSYDMTHYVAHARADAARLPIAVYRETSPQHFEGTAGGLYFKGKSSFKRCKDSVVLAEEPLSEPERAYMAGQVAMLAVNPLAAAAGNMHVGAGVDCTHWCAPGVPDLWNVALFNYLSAHLAALEEGA
ncbi:hypothetical protein JKP88DRAFT_198936 [Tribonema minus]|uniref:Trichome birefringence-like C-terminal domain-containing protein n=1 Tax=Tribonema minus TaxID=303371 RepID=A0A835Z1X0_9STRA|nr:hypothetical protein JKP88DRAFT_198936 [Tribonema minus]